MASKKKTGQGQVKGMQISGRMSLAHLWKDKKGGKVLENVGFWCHGVLRFWEGDLHGAAQLMKTVGQEARHLLQRAPYGFKRNLQKFQSVY